MSAAAGSPTHYDVLGVPRNADQAAIRKAYLRASLRSHPDKNPGREEEAKKEFVAVGRAYEVLRDPAKRAVYDRELGGGRRFGRPSSDYQQQQQQQQQQRRPQQQQQPSDAQTAQSSQAAQGGGSGQQQEKDDFEWFMGQFDETVSGMSEEELNMAMGAAAVVGSIVGSILGARAARGNNSLLSSAASMMGSAMASRAASTLVQTVHEDSRQRVLEKKERQAAIARGETVREPSADQNRERVVKDAGRAFQKVAGAAVGGSSNVNRSNGVTVSFGNARQASRRNSSGSGDERAGFNWQQAARLACMAVNACSEMQQSGQKKR